MTAVAENANIARHLPRMAAAQPQTAALKIPRGRTKAGKIDYLTLSFGELEREVGAWQKRLRDAGVKKGDRVLVMVRQGLPLIASVFAIFAHGAVPVVIDPGMGRKSFLNCVERTQPRVLLGIPLARLLSRVFRRAFASVKIRVPASGSTTDRLTKPLAKAKTKTKSGGGGKLSITHSDPGDLAAILFTSGSTGAPKGVCYTHGMFAWQVELIRSTYAIRPGEVDLPMLPIFALFNPALGMTTVVPEIDPSRPAEVDPAKIVQAILQEQVTNSFGSPTLWRKIARHCHRERIPLPNLKRVLCAGAPVPPMLWELMRPVLTNGDLHSPYGATEALPVSSIDSTTVVKETAALTQQGAGTCVGTIIKPNKVKIIGLHDGPIAALSQTTVLHTGEIGEIIVRGPSFTKEYDRLPEHTARAKIESWHRMGDCGYLDKLGRLWFCGRAAERVETSDGVLFTEQVEPLFNAHPAVRRSALIGLGERPEQQAAIVIEPRDAKLLKSAGACRELAQTLRELTRSHPHAGRITTVFFHPGFPVDVRHNAKIHRLTLAKWAQAEGTGHAVDATS